MIRRWSAHSCFHRDDPVRHGGQPGPSPAFARSRRATRGHYVRLGGAQPAADPDRAARRSPDRVGDHRGGRHGAVGRLPSATRPARACRRERRAPRTRAPVRPARRARRRAARSRPAPRARTGRGERGHHQARPPGPRRLMASPVASIIPPVDRRAALDRAHVGDIEGAIGTVQSHDTAPRRTIRRRLVTLVAVAGPGLIVMAADNDAGTMTVFGQAGHGYGTRLLWVLVLLAPALFVVQEMAARLGA